MKLQTNGILCSTYTNVNYESARVHSSLAIYTESITTSANAAILRVNKDTT